MAKTVHFIHLSDKPGGIEVLLPLIIKGLKDYNFSAFVIRPKKVDEISVYEEHSTHVHYGDYNSFFAFYKLYKYVIKHKRDIFHLYNTGPFFLFAFKLIGIKNLVYSIHGTKYWKTRNQKLIRKLIWIIALDDKIVFTSNSNFSARIFKENISPKAKIKTLYNPFNIKQFRNNKTAVNAENIKIIYVGRLVNGKKLPLWIEILENLIKLNLNVTGEIYGNGPLKKELESIIIEKNLSNYVKLMGHHSHIETIYQKADLLLFLSDYESFGNVVVESILCGTPVLTFNIPSMQEIFQNHPDFLIDRQGEFHKEISDKISNFPTLKASVNKAALEFSERFNSDRHLSELKALYEKFN